MFDVREAGKISNRDAGVYVTQSRFDVYLVASCYGSLLREYNVAFLFFKLRDDERNAIIEIQLPWNIGVVRLT